MVKAVELISDGTPIRKTFISRKDGIMNIPKAEYFAAIKKGI
jgi:hypothetical protein